MKMNSMTCIIIHSYSLSSSFLARNAQLGLDAVKQLDEFQEKLHFYQLDITNVENIRRFADYIKITYGGLDILINNAAVAFKVY